MVDEVRIGINDGHIIVFLDKLRNDISSHLTAADNDNLHFVLPHSKSKSVSIYYITGLSKKPYDCTISYTFFSSKTPSHKFENEAA